MSVNKEKVITALAESNSLSEAAKIANCSRQTIYNFLSDQTFCKQLRDLENRIEIEMFDNLIERREAALRTISEIMEDADNDSASRLKAAGMILNSFETSQARIRSTVDWAVELSNPLSDLI